MPRRRARLALPTGTQAVLVPRLDRALRANLLSSWIRTRHAQSHASVSQRVLDDG